MSAFPLRVAHIDDDEDLRAIVRLALQVTGGCAVESFESGQQALDRVPDFHPDVILIDVLMPGMSGVDTVCALRERMDLSDVAVVFATGLDEAQSRDFEGAGACAVIRKPFDAMKLAGQLQQICRR